MGYVVPNLNLSRCIWPRYSGFSSSTRMSSVHSSKFSADTSSIPGGSELLICAHRRQLRVAGEGAASAAQDDLGPTFWSSFASLLLAKERDMVKELREVGSRADARWFPKTGVRRATRW